MMRSKGEQNSRRKQDEKIFLSTSSAALSRLTPREGVGRDTKAEGGKGGMERERGRERVGRKRQERRGEKERGDGSEREES